MWATVTGNIYRKFREIWSVVFEICRRTNEQKDRQTDTLNAILRTPTGSTGFINTSYSGPGNGDWSN